MRLVYGCCAWFIGLWLATQWTQPWQLWVGLAIGCGVLMVVPGRKLSHPYPLIFASLGLLCLGAARYTISIPNLDSPDHIACYNFNSDCLSTREVTLTGLVTDEPDIRDRGINLRVQVEQVELDNGTIQPVEGFVLVQTPRFPVIEYGSRIEVTGQLTTPPENEEFSYRDFLARQNIHSLMSWSQPSVLEEKQGVPIRHLMLAIKQRAQTTINLLIPEPQSALLNGILLGTGNLLPPDLEEDFRRTGLTHIIVVSGYNISILAGVLVSAGEPIIGRRRAVYFALVGIVLFVLLVGLDVSVIRAAIMGGLYLIINRLLGRPYFAIGSLFLTGLLMTAFHPTALWDISFQLSFMATLGLMLFVEPLTSGFERRLKRWFERKVVKLIMGFLSDALIVTLAAQLFTIPLIVFYFKQVSVISLLANFLVLPVQPAIMVFGGLATLIGLFVLPIAQPFGWVAWFFLSYVTGVIELLARIPWAVIPLDLSVEGLLFLYAVLLTVAWYQQLPLEERGAILGRLGQGLPGRVALTSSFILTILIWQWGTTRPDNHLHIAFLDVNQGDAIFIQTPTGRQILVDGGFYPTLLHDRLASQMPFGDRTIDFVIATHPDADHVTGLPGVFERYEVGQFITDGSTADSSPIFAEVLAIAIDNGAEVRPALAGEVIEFGDGVRLEFIHPGRERHPSERNENSVSFRLVYGDFTLLLTGDAEEEGEADMVASGYPLRSLVFKAGHHGSRSSSNDFFLEAVQPQIVIISAGKDNRFGHPHQEVLDRTAAVGATLLRTDELGTIEVITDGTTMWWQAYHESQ